MTTARRRSYILQNPYAPEAQRFATTIFSMLGLRPVCIHTDPKTRFYLSREFPLLGDGFVEADIEADPDDLTSAVARIADRFDIAAVIPWDEDFVAPSADIAGQLGLGWNAPETVRRFRDKHALKTFVHSVDPGVRVPESRLVASVDDVYGGEVPDRFVIKPNDGSGNLDVSIFDAHERDAVAAKFGSADHTWVLEEFIGGEEYHIDGQIRPDGSIVTYGVFQYERTTVGDCDTVYRAERSVHTDEPVFAECEAYARRLLAASGLRSSPFHMEVKVDARGPAMIDLGARFGSDGMPDTLNRLHPELPEPHWLAINDYFQVACDSPPVSWEHYDSVYAAWAYGISDGYGQILNFSGTDEIERMPEFVTWAIRPETGRDLVPTTNLATVPWLAEFDVYGDLDEVTRVVEHARATVRFNVEPTAAQTARVRASSLVDRLANKARWAVHRTAGAVRSADGRSG